MVRVNLDTPRHLNGQGPYVFVWSAPHGPGWMLLSNIKGGDKLRQTISSRAASGFAHEGPAHISGKHDKMTFRAIGDSIASADSTDHAEHVLPHQRAGKNVASDYLQRHPSAKPSRTYYNVSLNLPEPGVPAVADDTAQPGDTFFVLHGQSYRREIALFRTGQRHSTRRQVWVFGYMAKQDPTRGVVPDPSRRGWVPLRDLQ